MKAASFFLACLLTTLFCWSLHPVFAEIYQYTDESGKTYYTNDPLSVPDQYREDVDIQGEIVTYPDAVESEPTYESDDESSATPKQNAPAEGSLGDGEALTAREAQFENEFKALQEERNSLNQAMDNVSTEEEFKEISAKIAAHDLRYKDFLQRREAFRQEVQQHNEQVMLEMEKKLEQYKARKAADSQSQPVQ